MSEFYEMMKEALVGEEPYHPDTGREALEASVRKFEKRMRTVRGMAIFMVTFASAVMVTGIYLLLGAEATTSTVRVAIYASLAFYGAATVGFAKLWFASMLNHIALMKEMKATQLHVVDLGKRIAAR